MLLLLRDDNTVSGFIFTGAVEGHLQLRFAGLPQACHISQDILSTEIGFHTNI